MTHRFTDTVQLSGTRKRNGGYLVADAAVARTGIQIYTGAEVGKPELATVRVYRAADEVFSQASMASFANIPVTDNHPSESVTADNWTLYAKGQTDGEVARDGDKLRIPLMVSDAVTIAKIEAGKRELSNGYTCDLDWTPGTTPDGQYFDAQQRNIRGNHVAIVQSGRAGPEFRIGDGAQEGGEGRQPWGVSPITKADRKETSMSTLQTVVLGDKAVQVEAADVAAIEAFKTASAKALTDAQTAATDAKAEHDKAMAAKDAEIEALQAKVLDDAALDKRVATRAKLVADAKAIAPDVKTAGLSDADIRKAVVTDKLGEAAVAGRSDAYLDARFDILVETADADAGKPDAFRDAAMTRDAKTALTDAEKARETYLDGFRTNHVKTEA